MSPRTQTVHFRSRSGLLTAQRDADWIVLDFPATPETECPAPAGLTAALGVSPRYVGRTCFDYLVELETEEAVRAVDPTSERYALWASAASSSRHGLPPVHMTLSRAFSHLDQG